MEEINLKKYIIVERTPSFNLSIKLVIPSGCKKRCPFCFNKLNNETVSRDKESFKGNFVNSLIQVVEAARTVNRHRDISLDITGNEPTNDVELFRYVIENVKRIRHLFNKVVVTSNGENIARVYMQMQGVVDIVNISVHHFLPSERISAFGCYGQHETDSLYSTIVSHLKEVGIHTTAVAVIYKPIDDDFRAFVSKFSEWCKSMGFDDIRLRSNFYKDDIFFVDYMNDGRFDGELRVVNGLWSKKFMVDGVEVLMLKGVRSLLDCVIGVEAVVYDDGLPYIDYGKEYPFKDIYVRHIYVR